MQHHGVKSSMVSSIAHKGDVLHVTFKGGKTYEYQGVSASQFHALQNADSIGRHLNAMKIKGSLLHPEHHGKP